MHVDTGTVSLNHSGGCFMDAFTIVLLVIFLIMAAVFIGLYFFTKNMEKKQEAVLQELGITRD